MSDVITQLFEQSVALSVQTSISTQKPLFVYISTAEDSMAKSFLMADSKLNGSVVNILSSGYVCLKILNGLAEFIQFKKMVPSALAPSFTIVKNGKLEGVVKELLQYDAFVQLLLKHAKSTTTHVPSAKTAPRSPSSVEKHKSDFARHKHEEAEERKRLRALIDADRRERQATAKYNEKKTTAKQASQHKKVTTDRFVLSVRLLDGEIVKGEFTGDQTLMDVKRWIEAGQNVNLTSSQSGLGIMTKPGFPEPSHIAFYAPGTRVTYTEPQELCRLRDLNLFPRLALILKPEYDDEALNTPNKSNLWRLAGAKISTVLLALYSFFDYGVDDAHRDIQSLSSLADEVHEVVEEEISHFALLMKDSTRPSEQPIDEILEVKKEEPVKELDYSLVGLTRLGTPAPSWTSRLHMSKTDLSQEDE